MKRNMDLIRTILFAIEELPADAVTDNLDLKTDRPPAEVVEHVRLLIDSGLVYGTMHRAAKKGAFFYVRGLTNEGHDRVQEIRDDTIWNKAKDLAKESGRDMTIETMKLFVGLAIQWGKSQLGLAGG